MKYPEALQKLIDLFKTLPAVGPKTAERYGLALLQQSQGQLEAWASSLTNLKSAVNFCRNCGLLSATPLCAICADKTRQAGQLCVVAASRDVLNLEQTKLFHGRYHVLGGLLDSLNNVNPTDLSIDQLLARLKAGHITEVILALDPTLAGETTSLYLKKLLSPLPLKITKLARGLSSGASLEYVDEATLAEALKHRQQV